MKQHRYNLKGWKNVVMMFAFCLAGTWVQAQQMINLPFDLWEEKEVVISKSGGESSVGFRVGTGIDLEFLVTVVNNELAKSGVFWLNASRIVPEDFDTVAKLWQGRLYFDVEMNNSGSVRLVVLRSKAGIVCLLRQSDTEDNPDRISVFNVSSDCAVNAAFPGRKTVVTLSGSQVGVSYIMDTDTLQGTGNPLTFEKVFTEGNYYVKAIKGNQMENMNGSVYISYYPFLKAGLCTEEKTIGGMLPFLPPFPGCGFASFQVPFIGRMSEEQLAQLDEMLTQINEGKSTCYPGFRILRNGISIGVMNGPNIKREEWLSEVFLSLNSGGNSKMYRIHVPLALSHAPILKSNLIEGIFNSLSDYSLKLDGCQLAVKYRLYRDGVLVQEKYSDMAEVIFKNLSGGGTYYVEAHYHGTVTRMNGEVFIDAGVGTMSYVKEMVYNKESAPVSTYTYYDGQGREIQTRQVKIGAGGKDLIAPHVYDNQGREAKLYLPYSIATTGYRKNAATEQAAYYQQKFGANSYAYAENVFADLPDDRITESSSPGYEMRLGGGHTTKSDLRKNTATDQVKRYVLSGTSLVLSGTYPANSLSVGVTTDPEGKVLQEFRDVAGNTVCKSEAGVSTYYVYDDLEHLRYIVPPLQDSLFTSGTRTLPELSKYCYYLEYDTRGRVSKQYIPGAGYTLTLYDLHDRPVFVQDARQRVSGQWRFTKYDRFDRPVIDGICTGNEADLKAALAAQTVFGEERGTALHGYTNLCPPVNATASGCLNITYYDDYGWTGQSSVAFSLADTLGVLRSDKVQGQVTGRKTKVLGITTDQWLLSGIYYDRFYRTIQSVAQLYPSGLEVTSNEHDFGGNVVRVKVRQTVGNIVNGYMKWMDYDDYGRLLSIRQEVSGDVTNKVVTLVRYDYDDFGRLRREVLHNGRDSVIYAYDLQGRKTGQTSSRFSYELGFEKPESSLSALVTPRYNGNISHVKWGNATTPDKGYTYAYDAHGQLTSSAYLQKSGSAWSSPTKYAEKGIRYDRNGNLKALYRTDAAGGRLHDIEYNYAVAGNGNAVSSVKVNGTASGTYVYDANGNLTTDGRRGVTITYNELNLPSTITKGSEKISYIYSASGEKLAQQTGSSLTHYRDVMVYAGNALSYIRHPLGMIRKTGTGYVYDYCLTDHLGSTRVLLESSGNTLSAVQTTDYYPYGLAFTYANLMLNKYLYSGKELQDASLGGEILGLYDYGSRYYDPMLGRWFCQDPALQLMSPYIFCGNNPIMFIDPDGEFIFTAILIGIAVSAVVDYAVQVAMNYASGYTGADAWLKKVDYFDIAVSGVIGGFTAGYGAAAKAGQMIGRFGKFLTNSPKLVALGETALTSTVDITGEGWQKVSGSEVATRLISSGIMYGTRTALQKTFKSKVKPRVESESFSPTDSKPYTLKIGEAELTTSSRLENPSRNYTIYNSKGELVKFGVTDANLERMKQSLRDAGKGAYVKYSPIVPKWQAHLQEKYMRSLFYNSTGKSYLEGMHIPFPVDFNTGKKVKPVKF